MKLKTDGNYLVGTGKHSEAVEKYTRYALFRLAPPSVSRIALRQVESSNTRIAGSADTVNL
jgi:hypothetical protein